MGLRPAVNQLTQGKFNRSREKKMIRCRTERCTGTFGLVPIVAKTATIGPKTPKFPH